MTIFAVLMSAPQPVLVERIGTSFPVDHLKISDTQYLVSASGTAQELSARLGIYDPKNPKAQPTGVAIVFATSGYFGRAPTNVWEWIKAKLEAAQRA